MEQQLSDHTDLSTKVQPGSYTPATRQRRLKTCVNRAARIKEWLAIDTNDDPVNDRLACRLVQSGLTTKDHLVVASETLSRLGQAYYDQSLGASVNAGIESAASQSMYPQSVKLDYPGVDEEALSEASRGRGQS